MSLQRETDYLPVTRQMNRNTNNKYVCPQFTRHKPLSPTQRALTNTCCDTGRMCTNQRRDRHTSFIVPTQACVCLRSEMSRMLRKSWVTRSAAQLVFCVHLWRHFDSAYEYMRWRRWMTVIQTNVNDGKERGEWINGKKWNDSLLNFQRELRWCKEMCVAVNARISLKKWIMERHLLLVLNIPSVSRSVM
jgi:hypothetical protein